MARFYGVVGYGNTAEDPDRPGIWVDSIVEFPYYGDVVNNSRQVQSLDKINSDISVQTTISIVADAYAREHFFAIRYVQWAGTYWVVSDVSVQSPRLLLRLGGVYNGPKAPAPIDP